MKDFTTKVAEGMKATTLLPLKLLTTKDSCIVRLGFAEGLMVSNDFQAKYTRLIPKAKSWSSEELAIKWALNNGYFIEIKN